MLSTYLLLYLIVERNFAGRYFLMLKKIELFICVKCFLQVRGIQFIGINRPSGPTTVPGVMRTVASLVSVSCTVLYCLGGATNRNQILSHLLYFVILPCNITVHTWQERLQV